MSRGTRTGSRVESQFSPDVTPLILAAQYNNHEIVQMFLSRNHTIERPHVISCQCADCVTKQNYDSLKRSTTSYDAGMVWDDMGCAGNSVYFNVDVHTLSYHHIPSHPSVVNERMLLWQPFER